MDTFQKSVLIIALFVLIALLISVGILLNKHSKNTSWPPTQNTCPDYWTEGTTEDATGKCKATAALNTGDGVTSTEIKDEEGNPIGDWTDKTRCEKRTWANDHNIMWSGVSNYNGCD